MLAYVNSFCYLYGVPILVDLPLSVILLDIIHAMVYYDENINRRFDMSRYTEAKKESNKRWNNKQFQLAIRIKPELKARIDQHCAETGESIVSFVVNAIEKQLQ